jgi:hypothetical protein
MDEQCLIEMMEALKGFEEYTYYRSQSCFHFNNLTSKQFLKLYMIIQKYDLTFKIDGGLKIWL